MKYKYILFDLDGTLSQSAPGIRLSLEKTLADLGIKGIDLSDYTKYIGPPLADTLKNLCGASDELIDKGYDIYKKHYENEGCFLNASYPGIEDVLKALRSRGVKTAVCTSKLEESARAVLKYIGLDGYFDSICGSNRNGSRKDKRDLIPYAVESLGGSARDMSRAVMLGDTRYDAKGAMECGVDFIACLYGYGDPEEMEKYMPASYARTPGDIPNLLK